MDLSMIYAYPKTEKLITHQFFNHQSQNLIYLDFVLHVELEPRRTMHCASV